MESSTSTSKCQKQSFQSTSEYKETPLGNDSQSLCKNQEKKCIEERTASILSPIVESAVRSNHHGSPVMLHDSEPDPQEIEKLFRILFESDTTAFSELLGHEPERTVFKPIRRRFAPYSIHQQLFMQQQQEQERRRQSFMSLASSRTTSASRDFRDIFRFRDARHMPSDMFRSKIVRTVIAFINKYSTRLTSTEDDCCEKCVICMYNYQENQGLRELRCNHRFHKKCIDEWLVKSYLCPVCRTDLTGTGKIYNGLAVLYQMWKQEGKCNPASTDNVELGKTVTNQSLI